MDVCSISSNISLAGAGYSSGDVKMKTKILIGIKEIFLFLLMAVIFGCGFMTLILLIIGDVK